MVGNTYQDCCPSPVVIPALDKARKSRVWIHGNCIISVTPLEDPGCCQIVHRRPTGVLAFNTRLLNPSQQTHSSATKRTISKTGSGYKDDELGILGSYESTVENGVSTNTGNNNPVEDGSTTILSSTRLRAPSINISMTDASGQQTRPRNLSFSESFRSEPLQSQSIDFPVIDPSFMILQFTSYPSSAPPGTITEVPTFVHLDDAAYRSISVLDRTPITDLYKTGIIYVGKGQTTEISILGNTCGSRLYTNFICSIGTLTSLLQAQARNMYTGGLDTSTELNDGPTAVLFVRDQRTEQTVFHVCTLMPNRVHDPLFTAKKRHIGNDFVNIVWNESGELFMHDTIPGQFNFVLVIIEPVLNNTNDTNNYGTGTYPAALFRVRLSVKPGLPDPKPSVDENVVLCGNSLAEYIRQIVIHAHIYCQVASAPEHAFVSNAKERLRQIKRFRARIDHPILVNSLDFTRNLG